MKLIPVSFKFYSVQIVLEEWGVSTYARIYVFSMAVIYFTPDVWQNWFHDPCFIVVSASDILAVSLSLHYSEPGANDSEDRIDGITVSKTHSHNCQQ